MWTIEYDNDTGPGDDSFWEWWTVTKDDNDLDGPAFKCDSQKSADWLRDLLNKYAKED